MTTAVIGASSVIVYRSQTEANIDQAIGSGEFFCIMAGVVFLFVAVYGLTALLPARFPKHNRERVILFLSGIIGVVGTIYLWGKL